MPTVANIELAKSIQSWVGLNKQDPNPQVKAAVGLANQFLQALHTLNANPGTPHAVDAAQAAQEAQNQTPQIAKANYAVTGRR